MIRTLTTSADAQWVAARDGRKVVLLANGALPAVGQLELESDNAELVLLGPPNVLAVVTPTRVTLHQPPYLDQVAHLDLEQPSRLAAVTGPRLVLTSNDGAHVTIVRAAGRALSVQNVEPGTPVEFAVGLERNQVLLGLTRKLEVWDAVSGRPLLRPQLALPPAPRTVGAAQGHLWATRSGSDEVFVYRLSDGRPFRHFVGASVQGVVCHPASPVVVLETARGLVRMHCFAHSLLLVDRAPWTPGAPLALLVQGEDVSLIGMPDAGGEPWRVPVLGSGAAAVTTEAEPADASGHVSAADKLRAMRSGPDHGDAAPVRTESRAPVAKSWREPLTVYAGELVRGIDGEVPVVSVETELGELAHRLGLGGPARRALTALYALYLVGEPALSIARLARALGDWTEPLGQGELAAFALIDKHGGKVSLRRAVTELLDGAPPCALRLVGGPPTTPREGAFRVSRDGRADLTIESELAAHLGRIGIAVGDVADALLEARLHGASCVSFAPPGDKPRPWPRGAGLVLVLYGTQSAWIADLPKLELGNEG